MQITGTDIYMTRGDSESILVSCPDRPFAAGDKVELTVREFAGAGRVLLRKEVSAFADGKALIVFAPEDTAALPFGAAFYDVQATFTDLGVKTIVRPGRFEIGRECTYAE